VPPDKMAEFSKRAFGADIAIWGKVEKAGGEFRIFGRALDLRQSASKLALDEVFIAEDQQKVRYAAEKIIDTFSAGKKTSDQVRITEERGKVADDPGLKRENLVKNGDLERGGESPDGWEKVDGLTIFWESGHSPTGKCIRIDTDVYQAEAKPWAAKVRAGASPSAAPAKTPTKGPKYDTIGGTDGVHYYSDPIPVKPGMTYRLSYDMKGKWIDGRPPFVAKVWIKGYSAFEDKAFGDQDRVTYDSYKACRTETQGKEWEHFTRTFQPVKAVVIYDFESAFDKGEMGRKVAAALREKAANKLPLATAKQTQDATQKANFTARHDALVSDIADFTASKLGGGLALWGKVEKEGDGYKIHARAYDLRQKRTRPILDEAIDCKTPSDLPALALRIVNRLGEGFKLVKAMRIMIYCYWPPDLYYFDNLRITEEPEGAAEE